MLSSVRQLKHWSPLPGFGLAMGYTLVYLSLLVILPLSTLIFKTATMSPERFWSVLVDSRVNAAFRLTFGASFAAAILNVFIGVLVAWVLVRYPFPGRRLVDGLVDLPFALPTAVAGICLTAVYAPNGFIGKHLAPLGIKVAYTPLGIVIALTFVGLPFVIRTVQPVLQDMDREVEEAAASLGAGRLQTVIRIIAPLVLPAVVTGFTLAFARAVGEYGSVIFIAGNLPMKTEIAPLLIMSRLEEYDYAGATAVAVIMLTVSFLMVLTINVLQRWNNRWR